MGHPAGSTGAGCAAVLSFSCPTRPVKIRREKRKTGRAFSRSARLGVKGSPVRIRPPRPRKREVFSGGRDRGTPVRTSRCLALTERANASHVLARGRNARPVCDIVTHA
jgi:hypothetical protein